MVKDSCCVTQCLLLLWSCVECLVCCRTCIERLEYDGWNDAVFNYSGKYLLTYEVGFDYFDFMVKNKLPFNAHWEGMKNNYRRSLTIGLLCSKTVHR